MKEKGKDKEKKKKKKRQKKGHGKNGIKMQKGNTKKYTKRILV